MDYASTHRDFDQILHDMQNSKTLSKLQNINPFRSGYHEVDSEDCLSTDSEPTPNYDTSQRRFKLYTIILSITTILFGLQSLYFWLRPANICTPNPYQNGHETEWQPAKIAIEQEKVTFTSAFRYNAISKVYYREYNLSEPQFVGVPRPEIDKAWEDLLAGQYLVISEEEAKDLDNPVPIRGIYLAEVEVMHSLHCVNAIRKALYWDYYSLHDKHPLSEDLQQIHIEHCLDQLRQTVQCAGDLTPVPLRPYGNDPNINLIGTPQEHTCRNWGAFRQWYTQRGEKYGKIDSAGT